MFLSQYDYEESEFLVFFSNSEIFFFKEARFGGFIKKTLLS